MKKISRKLLCLLLTVAMLWSVGSGFASAAKDGDFGRGAGITGESSEKSGATRRADNNVRYVRITSASELTDGEYVILAATTGSYAGDYSHYVLSTQEDGTYLAMQGGPLDFGSLPAAVLIQEDVTSFYAWTVTGNAGSFTIATESGEYLVTEQNSSSLSLGTTAAKWTGTYDSSKGGFLLTSNSLYLALRDDTSEVGDNNGCLFTMVGSGSFTVVMQLYKKELPAGCTHNSTSTSTTPATCTQSGQILVTCNDCGATVSTSVIPATGHSMNTSTTYPSCTTEGKTVELCTVCGFVASTVVMPATGHTTTITTTPASCTVDGLIVESCTTCGITISTTAIAATGHEVSTTTIPATCTEDGLVEEICATCGITLYSEIIPATGHSTVVTTTPPTCEEDGVTEESCLICGEIIEVTGTPAPGHSCVYTSNNNGTHVATCINCDYSAEEKCLLKNYTCSSCGYVSEPEAELRDGRYVIAAKVQDVYYAMSNVFAGKISGVPIPVTEDGRVLSTDAEGYVIQLGTVEGGRTITGADGVYLKYGSSTNLGKSAEPYVWKLFTGTNGSYRVAADGNGRGLVFRAEAYNQFGGYATGNCSQGDTEYFDVEFLPIRYVVDDEIPPEPFSVKIGHTLNLASDISVNYAVSAAALEGYEDIYMECVVPTYQANTQTGATVVTIDGELKGNYYYFTMDGLTAIQMNDMLEATVYAAKEGTRYVSETDRYSIATYAYNQLNKASASSELKTLCAELLRYGAKAQIYKAYRTDAMADSAMTAAHKKLLSDLDAVTFGNHNTVLTDIADPTVSWVGKSLILDSKVTLRMVFDLSKFGGKTSDLSARVTYVNMAGEEVTVTLSNAIVYNFEKNYYAFDFSGLQAAELRTVLSAAVYAGGKQVSPTLQYSVDTYGNGRSGNLLTLCQALVAYSDGARNYFGK